MLTWLLDRETNTLTDQMPETAPNRQRRPRPARRRTVSGFVQNTILAGILVAIPLVVTWFVLQFLFNLAARVGRPWVEFVVQEFVSPARPEIGGFLSQDAVTNIVAVLSVVVFLFLLGVFTRQVIGRRLVNIFNRVVESIPFANQVYGATRQLVDALQTKPDGVQRVVFIDFPSPEMKAIGLVTRTMFDADTGEELAAVFVPTTPNPTNGYLEVVPVSRLINTTMTLDEAMSFVISGGAVGPADINYTFSAPDND